MHRVTDSCLKTLGWQKYSHEQYGLKAWGSSGPYQKVYEHFGITGTSEYQSHALLRTRVTRISRSCGRRNEGCRILQEAGRPRYLSSGESHPSLNPPLRFRGSSGKLKAMKSYKDVVNPRFFLTVESLRWAVLCCTHQLK